MHEEEIRRTKKILAYFLNNPETLKKISLDEMKDLFRMAVITMKNCEDQECWEMGIQLFYESCLTADLDIKDMWAIYWQLTYCKFSRYGVGRGIDLTNLYRRIFRYMDEKTKKYKEIEHADSNLIVMVTSQMLGIGHAPTRRILDYSYAISNALNKKVMIINDFGLHYKTQDYLDFLDRSFNFLTELAGVAFLRYKDKKFLFKQLNGEQPDIDEINETLEMIYQLKPELVYNIGGSSLLTDLCGTFTKTACFPCSSNIPISMSQNLFVGRKLADGDRERLGSLEPYQRVHETVINYQMDGSRMVYSRKQFGLKKEMFLISVIGNRLSKEFDSRFAAVMNHIMEKAEVHFLVIGDDKNMETIKNTIKRKENVHFTGALADASQAVKLCDLYCNPLRSGGGRSSFEALTQGVPVVTLEYGDVYYTCGEKFGVKNEEEYTDKVIYYVQHPEYRREMSEEARKRAAYLSDIEKTQSELLKKIL